MTVAMAPGAVAMTKISLLNEARALTGTDAVETADRSGVCSFSKTKSESGNGGRSEQQLHNFSPRAAIGVLQELL
jgi:hypothetical protein